jgi:hypothetical protein
MYASKMLDFSFFDSLYLSNCDLINKKSLTCVSEMPGAHRLSISVLSCENNSSSRSFHPLEESFLFLYLIGLRKPLLSFNRRSNEADSFKAELILSKKTETSFFCVHLFSENMNQLTFEKNSKGNNFFDLKSKVNVEFYMEIREFLEDNRLDQRLKGLNFSIQTFFKNCGLRLGVKSFSKDFTQNVSFFWMSR